MWQNYNKAQNAILCVSSTGKQEASCNCHAKSTYHSRTLVVFPKALFDAVPGTGNPALAQETKDTVKKTAVGLDDKWGLDHGAWSVIKHLYPDADVPVVQMSLDYYQTPQYHYELANELASLREKGADRWQW